MNPVTRYDLSGLSWIPLNRQRRWGWATLVAIGAFAVYLLVVVATSGSNLKPLLFIAPALLVAVACLGFATTAPGAIAVEVTDAEVTLEFRNGRRWSQYWRMEDFRLAIERAPALGPRSSVPVPVWGCLRSGHGVQLCDEGCLQRHPPESHGARPCYPAGH